MAFTKEAPAGSWSVNDALKVVVEDVKNGHYGSVAEAIDEMKRLTGKNEFSKTVYSKLSDAWAE